MHEESPYRSEDILKRGAERLESEAISIHRDDKLSPSQRKEAFLTWLTQADKLQDQELDAGAPKSSGLLGLRYFNVLNTLVNIQKELDRASSSK